MMTIFLLLYLFIGHAYSNVASANHSCMEKADSVGVTLTINLEKVKMEDATKD